MSMNKTSQQQQETQKVPERIMVVDISQAESSPAAAASRPASREPNRSFHVGGTRIRAHLRTTAPLAEHAYQGMGCNLER